MKSNPSKGTLKTIRIPYHGIRALELHGEAGWQLLSTTVSFCHCGYSTHTNVVTVKYGLFPSSGVHVYTVYLACMLVCLFAYWLTCVRVPLYKDVYWSFLSYRMERNEMVLTLPAFIILSINNFMTLPDGKIIVHQIKSV